MKHNLILYIIGATLIILGCNNEEYLELTPRGQATEANFYRNATEIEQGLIAVYDVLQWGGTDGWTMSLGLNNAASDDCFAGGSDASDQPSWVAMDNFTLNPDLGPQSGYWRKYYAGIARANLIIQKTNELEDLDAEFKARTLAEAKFLRAYFYFDLVRYFGNVILSTDRISPDAIFTQSQVPATEVYAQIEADLLDAYNTFELPETVPSDDLGRVTKGAVTALLGKVLLYQNDNGRMAEAATYFDEVVNSGVYFLESDFANIFNPGNEWGPESIFEINHSDNQRGGWENFSNGTEGNYSVQFFGIRDYVPALNFSPVYATGWSFCPVTTELVDAMQFDPRFVHTIIDGNELKSLGGSYTEGFQNTDYFIRKYAPLASVKALDGEPALNWRNNEIIIRLADVMLMGAEAHNRSGNDTKAKDYLNQVRARVGLSPILFSNGATLLEEIYKERRLELATEGHRFFDLVRTGRAGDVLPGFVVGTHEVLPIPQREIDLSNNILVQNPGY